METFNILDSSPQECLEFKPHSYHTMCFCSFSSREHALHWIHKIVPKDKNAQFHKWSSITARGKRKKKIRATFANNVINNLEKMDFKVYCISSIESDISHFAQYFFSRNLGKITQEVQQNGTNYLIFKITKTKTIKMPVLRAARLMWVVDVCRLLQSEFNLKGDILSDRFALDSYETEDPAEGVSLTNFLLKQTGVNLQLSIPIKGANNIYELIPDWFAGWCRSHMEQSGFLKKEFEALQSNSNKRFQSLKFVPSNSILYGQHCSYMEFNTTTSTLKLVFGLH